MTGRAHLDRFLEALHRDEEIPKDIRQWLLAGIEEFECTGDLAGALRLKACRAARQSRNEHLREAGRMLGTDTPATVRARRIIRAASTLSAYADEPEAVSRVVGNGWQKQVWLAMLNAPLPGYSTIRQMMPMP